MKKTVLLGLVLAAFIVGSVFIFGKSFGVLGVLAVVAIVAILCIVEFMRSMKLLKAIEAAPEGYTPHAQILHRQIAVGMSLIKIVKIAQALGKKVSESPAIYIWEDKHHQVKVTLQDQKAQNIELIEIFSSQDNSQDPDL